MKSKIQSQIFLELTGDELNELCSLIDHGRYRLEDFITELRASKKVDESLIQSHLRLIEISKQYTNLRARL